MQRHLDPLVGELKLVEDDMSEQGIDLLRNVYSSVARIFPMCFILVLKQGPRAQNLLMVEKVIQLSMLCASLT